MGRVREGAAAPLHADLPGKIRVRFHDPRLDNHLRGLGVEVANQILDELQALDHVRDDEGVGPRIDRDLSARGQEVFGLVLQLRGLGVGHADEACFDGEDVLDLFLAGDLRLQLLFE